MRLFSVCFLKKPVNDFAAVVVRRLVKAHFSGVSFEGLRQHGLIAELVDLQGRIKKSVFVSHYLKVESIKYSATSKRCNINNGKRLTRLIIFSSSKCHSQDNYYCYNCNYDCNYQI